MTTAVKLSTYDKVSRLIEFALGEPYGDGEIVTDVLSGYAEPGYRGRGTFMDPEAPIIVLGNWNDKTRYVDGERIVMNDLPSRLARSLERVGAEIEWLDEWAQCQECQRAVRTQPDSYQWKPFYEWVTDSGPICADCLVKDGEDALTGYGNDEDSHISSADNGLRSGVTWCEPEHVESFGFVKWEPGNPQTYASGWFDHMTDDPQKILDAILEREPTAEVIFFLDEASQFYIRFSAYVRIPESDDEPELDYCGDGVVLGRGQLEEG